MRSKNTITTFPSNTFQISPYKTHYLPCHPHWPYPQYRRPSHLRDALSRLCGARHLKFFRRFGSVHLFKKGNFEDWFVDDFEKWWDFKDVVGP